MTNLLLYILPIVLSHIRYILAPSCKSGTIHGGQNDAHNLFIYMSYVLTHSLNGRMNSENRSISKLDFSAYDGYFFKRTTDPI